MRNRHCAECGHRASGSARFCEQCGTALTRSAQPLRAPSTLEARILDERTAIEGERKQVTVMYTDIVGSMQLTHALDGERWGFALDRFLAIAAGAVHAFEGTVNQFTGDGLLAVFGAPLAHEDHARRACLAVLQLQREVAGLAAELARSDGVEFAIRCGLNSGEVVVGAIGDDVHMDFVPLGNTTALGKRIESLAPEGSTAISASTAALVDGEFELRELGEFELKGAQGRQRVLELIGLGAARTRLAAIAATRGLSPFVGRDAQSTELRSALEHALAGHGRAVGIVGDPGVGKSRLVHEFVAACAARGVAVNSTSGVAHGRYVPYLPVLALFRDVFAIGERDAPEVARERIERAMRTLDPAFADDLALLFEFLGLADGDPPPALDLANDRRRLLAVATRAITARGRHEPAVLVVEDLHWLDDASDAFLEELVGALSDTRMLLVGTYRPEYDAAWARHAPHAELALAALDADATDDLLHGLLGRDRSLERLAALIQARAVGNPFFIEEIVQALVENGHLGGGRGAHRVAVQPEGVVLPATVQAALGARIDRLPAREKALVQMMSVIGTAVPGPLLKEVCGLGEDELAEAVAALAGSRWVVPGGSGKDHELVFRHPLTQEVAYGSLLSDRRARAHHAVAGAIVRAYPDGLDERAALLAHHCEEAGDALDAAGWHARAAVWTEAKSPADGMRHWRRVQAITNGLPASAACEDLAARARIGILSLSWRLGILREETAAIHAAAHGDVERFRRDLFYAGSLMHSGREREGLDGFRAASRQAVAAGDVGGALTASAGVAYANWIAGSLSEALATLDAALALAGDDPRTGSGLAFACPLAHAFGDRAHSLGYMGELHTARRHFERAIELAREHDDPETQSAGYGNRALLEAHVGAVAAALDNAARGLAIAERAGNTIHAIACSTPVAVAEGAARRFAEALARAAFNLAAIREHGIGLYYEPLLLATVAQSELGLGQREAALAAAEEAVAIMDARGLAACALAAPIALARVLLATYGAAARERIDTVLTDALHVARASEARVFEAPIRRELASVARLRG